MDDAEIAAWKVAIASDNTKFMSGEISRDEFFSRVHARDEQLAALPAAERARVNALLLA